MPLNYDPNGSNFVGGSVNNDAFYRVVFSGEFAGQANITQFYYRVGLGGLPGGLNFGGADVLADLVYNQVWKDNLRAAHSTLYTLQHIAVYPFNATFDALFSAPFIYEVGEVGLNNAQPSGSAPCAIVSYALEGTALGINGFFPPKRAYTAFGPTSEVDTDSQGRFTPTFRAFLSEKFAGAVQDLVSVVPPVVYFPIRIAVRYVAGVPVLYGFSDIMNSDPIVRTKQSFRRSRVQEA